MPYYYHFIESFPTIQDLANASEQSVLKHWEGLGYYSRARNLHATAQYISKELGGKFPNTYRQLLQLKGVGPYTAAAIASFCFDEPIPVLDGNVFRFISRYFGITDDISQQKSRKVFLDVLDELIPEKHPADFNQATMEFGATVCKPSPDCGNCPFTSGCYAFKNKAQKDLPVKLSKPKISEKYFHYLIIEHHGQYLMQKRTSSIWKGLYEFLLHEASDDSEQDQIPIDNQRISMVSKSEKYKHLLTHRIIWITFYHMTVEEKYFVELINEFKLSPYSYEEMLTLPKPKSIINYLQQVGF